MATAQRLEKLDRFFDLIQIQVTGSVRNMSDRFAVSESTIKRMIKDLEYYKKVKIKYCRRCHSYVLDCNTLDPFRLNDSYVKRDFSAS